MLRVHKIKVNHIVYMILGFIFKSGGVGLFEYGRLLDSNYEIQFT